MLKRGPIELWLNPLWAGDGLAYKSTRQVATSQSVRSAILEAARSGAPSAITEPGAPSIDCQSRQCDPIGVRTIFDADGSFSSTLHLDQPTVVAINQGWSRDWKVYVDGRKVPTFPINGFFLGFKAPSGPVSVTGKYSPGWAIPALFVSLLSAVMALALSISPSVMERRRKRSAYSVAT